MSCYTLGSSVQARVRMVYVLTTVMTFVIGMSISVLISALNVQFMKAVSQEYVARVGSIFNAGACAATPAASLAVSALAAFCTVSQIFLFSGAVCVIIFLVMKLSGIRLEQGYDRE